jgi:uncharacterized protein YbaP (TraB family)
MKKGLLFVLLSIFLFSSNELLAKGYFYEVSTDSSKVYVFGSIHLAKESAYPLDTIVENTFLRCRNVVFEININQINPFQLLQYGVLQDTSTLENSIPAKYFKILDSIFVSNHIPKVFYNKLQPWMAVLLALNLEIVSSGEDFVDGIEMYFMKKLDSTKKVLELESFVEQLNVFKKLYELSPDFFFEYFLIENIEKPEDFDKLFNAWLNGDEQAVMDEINRNFDETELNRKYNQILNTDRNFRMAEKIIEFLKSKDCFFVIVGSAHLFGENGLINILKSRGYKVLRKI